MLQMGMLLTLNTLFDVLLIITFHGQSIVPYTKDTLGDDCTIEMTSIDTMMIGLYGNEIISKIKAT